MNVLIAGVEVYFPENILQKSWEMYKADPTKKHLAGWVQERSMSYLPMDWE